MDIIILAALSISFAINIVITITEVKTNTSKYDNNLALCANTAFVGIPFSCIAVSANFPQFIILAYWILFYVSSDILLAVTSKKYFSVNIDSVTGMMILALLPISFVFLRKYQIVFTFGSISYLGCAILLAIIKTFSKSDAGDSVKR